MRYARDWMKVDADKRINLEEEELLVKFFGREYIDYRDSTRVGIPFI